MNEDLILTRRANALIARATIAVDVACAKPLRGPPNAVGQRARFPVRLAVDDAEGIDATA